MGLEQRQHTGERVGSSDGTVMQVGCGMTATKMACSGSVSMPTPSLFLSVPLSV
jgi:hypothetical protein